MATLKASAQKGALSSEARVTTSSWPGTCPVMGGTSVGAGRKSQTASSRGCTPLLRRAEPASTGTILQAIVPLRRAVTNAAVSTGLPSRYAAAMLSSKSAAASTSFSRAAATASTMDKGTPSSRGGSSSAPEKKMARSRIESTTPANWSSAPMGSWTGTGRAPRRVWISSTTARKSAPGRSILLMNARRGTWNWSAWCHTVSDCGSTPDTAQKTTTAPSSTRSERSTSMVKSTWPGVSMRWMSCVSPERFHSSVVAAAVMVMPRSRSCGIQSICASAS